MSSCSTPWCAEYVSWQIAARMPGSLHAATAAPTLEQGIDEAERVFEQVAAAGVDYDDVVQVLEREGVEKFEKSFADLIADVENKRDALVTA